MYPDNVRYTEEHEWVRDDSGYYTVGISAYAAEKLGDITYVELPDVGAEFKQGAEAGAIESVKAASEVYSPLEGTVVEVNQELEERPELVNESPYGEGWLFKLKDVNAEEINSLMDASAYEKFVKEQE